MNDTIRKAILVLLSEELIVASWGITQILVRESSISFNVTGFLYQGKVTISAIESEYSIRFSNGYAMETSLDKLVSELDRYIERDSHYEERLKRWLDSI